MAAYSGTGAHPMEATAGSMTAEHERLLREHLQLQRQLLDMQQHQQHQQHQQQLLDMQMFYGQPPMQNMPPDLAAFPDLSSDLLLAQPVLAATQQREAVGWWPHALSQQHQLHPNLLRPPLAAATVRRGRESNHVAPGAVACHVGPSCSAAADGKDGHNHAASAASAASDASAASSLPLSASAATITCPPPPSSASGLFLSLPSHPPPHLPSPSSSTSPSASSNTTTPAFYTHQPPLHHPKPQHLRQQQALTALAQSSVSSVPEPKSAKTVKRAKTPAPSTSSSPTKRQSRLESIYATIRRATTMRRSRVSIQNAHAQPVTVSPMATLRDTSDSNTNTNNNGLSHHRKMAPAHLDLSGLPNTGIMEAVTAAGSLSAMPTPPLSGPDSSLSSSVSSSLGDVYDNSFQHPLLAHFQQQQQPLSGSGPADYGLVSGLVDDPFVDQGGSYFGTSVQPQFQMPQRPYSAAQMTASSPVKHEVPTDMGAGHCGLDFSPTAYLADATATMSGSSLIAAAQAQAQMAAAPQLSADMDMDMNMDEPDWWRQSVVDSAVGESAASAPAQQISAVDGLPYDAGLSMSGLMISMPEQPHLSQPMARTVSMPLAPPQPPRTPGIYGMADSAVLPQPPPESACHRRSKPRAPSAGARHHYHAGGLSPRKRGAAYEDPSSGYAPVPTSAPAMARRSHSMQTLRTSSSSSSMSAAAAAGAGASSTSAGVRKRRSANNMRRTMSSQSALGGEAPRTPSGRRATSVGARPSASNGDSSNNNSNSGNTFAIGFVNFTPEDGTEIMNGVAPSGSSKTKARRDREQLERENFLKEALHLVGNGNMGPDEAIQTTQQVMHSSTMMVV